MPQMPVPVNRPLESFKVSTVVAQEQQKDVELRINALDTRIQSYVEANIIKDFPLITAILNITHDKEQLEKLGKSIERVANLITQRDELASIRTVLDLLVTQPEKIAAVAGDFLGDDNDFDIDKLIQE